MRFSPKSVLSAFILITLSVFFIGGFSSCATKYKVRYFNNIPDSIHNEPIAMEHTIYTDPLIQPRDVLQISVQTLDGRSSDVMTSGQSALGGSSGAAASGGGSGGGASTPTPGYVVDDNGYIEVPLVGRVKVQGMTTTQARELLSQKASQYYKDPVVNVRCTNFSITVLGEVNRPGKYVVDNEKVSILDAIGIAGDLSITAKRDNILLVREDNGNKLFVRLNINSSDIFKSPYYYMQKGDVIYVEPNKSKTASSDSYVRDRNISLGVTLLTTLVTVATLIITLSK
jgi:polysaccharide export outer membrane protein